MSRNPTSGDCRLRNPDPDRDLVFRLVSGAPQTPANLRRISRHAAFPGTAKGIWRATRGNARQGPHRRKAFARPACRLLGLRSARPVLGNARAVRKNCRRNASARTARNAAAVRVRSAAELRMAWLRDRRMPGLLPSLNGSAPSDPNPTKTSLAISRSRIKRVLRLCARRFYAFCASCPPCAFPPLPRPKLAEYWAKRAVLSPKFP